MTAAEVLARFPALTPEQAAEVEALKAERAEVGSRVTELQKRIGRLTRKLDPLVEEADGLAARIAGAVIVASRHELVAADLERGSYTHLGRRYTLVAREGDGITGHVVGKGAKKRRMYTGTMRADGPGRWIDGRGDMWVEVNE